MVKGHDRLRAFENAQVRQHTSGYLHNLRIFEALYREAQTLGVLPPGDPLEGIEVDIRRTRRLHVRATSEDAGTDAR